MNTEIAHASASSGQDNILIIGAGFTVEGNVRGKGTLLVSGSVNGNLIADTVKLTETAHVAGRVECKQLDLSGRLVGSFDAADVVVRAGGIVITQTEAVSRGTCLVAGTFSGQLKAHQLKVDGTGQLSGQTNAVQMDVLGQVRGEVDVGNMVVRNQGVVDGKVTYTNLAMEQGSDVTGQLERKQRQATPAPARAPATASTAEDKVVLQLPPHIAAQLRKQPDAAQLDLANGDPLPTWITMDPKQPRLVLAKTELDALSAKGESITVRVRVGDETLVFQLPPDAS